MPDADAIRTTISEYLARFTANDREGWLELWADDATMEDPVGSPLRTGKESIGEFWDHGHQAADSIELRPAEPPIVIGDQAAFTFEVRPTLGGAAFFLPCIDVMTFDEQARITSQRAFVDFSMMGPAPD
jgi:steroid delta-isomerase